jgi:type IV fimbrial biogenesis protein FimT
MQRKATTAQSGFTMIELLTVVSIVAVLAAVGIPSLLDTVRSAQLRSASSQLYDALLLARSEAVKRNIEVDVQPGTSCVTPASSNTAAWTTGWSVWTITLAGACDTVQQNFPATTNIGITPAAGGISYLPTGRITTTSTNSFDFKSIKSATIPERCIVISASGQPSIRTGAANSACS